MKKLVFLAVLLMSPAAMAQSDAFVNGKYVPPWQRTETASSTTAATGPVAGPSTVQRQPAYKPPWQQATANGSNSNAGAAGNGAAGSPPHGPQLANIKARITERMTQRIAEIQQHLACVQAAASPEALRACMPERGGPGGGGQGRLGMNGPPGAEGQRPGERLAQGSPDRMPPPGGPTSEAQ